MLVPPTSLSVAPGEVLLVVAQPQVSRTALALLLSGRMKTSSGQLAWGGDSRLSSLRKRAAIIDSPAVNEPEAHLKVRDVISEDLSLLPAPLWHRQSPKKWMAQHRVADLANEWIDAIDPLVRAELLVALAAENRETQLLVLDSPDRHGIEAPQWLQLLERFAHSRRNFACVAVAGQLPDCWEGPVVFMGEDSGGTAEAPAGPAVDPESEDTAGPIGEARELADASEDVAGTTAADPSPAPEPDSIPAEPSPPTAALADLPAAEPVLEPSEPKD